MRITRKSAEDATTKRNPLRAIHLKKVKTLKTGGLHFFWLYKLFRGFVKISFNEACGVYERKTIIILHTLN